MDSTSLKSTLPNPGTTSRFAGVVPVLQQEGRVITPLPGGDRGDRVTGGQLLRRSLALNPCPSPVLNPLSAARTVIVEQRQLLSCYLKIPIDINSEEEFTRLIGYHPELSIAWILKHTRKDILQSVLTAELIYKHLLTVNDLPEAALTPQLALECLQEISHYWKYETLPSRLKTSVFKQRCLQASVLPINLAPAVIRSSLNNDYSALVGKNPNNIKYVPVEYQSFDLCSKAICKDVRVIEFVNPAVVGYEELCHMAIKEHGVAYYCIPPDRITEKMILEKVAQDEDPSVQLYLIPEDFRTYERCLNALRTRISQARLIPTRIFHEHPELAEEILNSNTEEAPGLCTLPDELKTEAYCQKYLSKWPDSIYGVPQFLLEQHPEWVKLALSQRGCNLHALPESSRSIDLCHRALKANYPSSDAVPAKRFEDNLDLIFLAVENIDGGLEKIPERLRTLEVCCAALAATNPKCMTKTMGLIPDAVRKALPYELLLAVAPEYLPMDIRQAMLVKGDTSLPAAYRHQNVKPVLPRRNLMEPLEPSPYGELKLSSSVFLKKILLSTDPFNLRNQSLGHALRQSIQQHCQQQLQSLNRGVVPRSQPVSKDSIIYGGRTLMVNAQDGCTTRMKFLRREESLDDFFREEAVHRFAWEQASVLALESEIPKPVGLKLVPIDQMPVDILNKFRSKPEQVVIGDQSFYLVYEFTTINEDYSRLAHQKDSNGDSTRAEQGLMKACHDLGVWSSLGAVHTSTIKAFHSFKNNRRELFLCFMFNCSRFFPGALTAWDSRATDESDWGYTGLRDIGDMEFYPEITSYFDAKDTIALLPVGFGQRAAFMNAFCENIVAAVLHYARMHRDDPDYHYKNGEGREKLGAFIDQAISACLSGIMGRPISTESCFESSAIYRQWLEKTTAETALWTARQSLDTDCFAQSLKKTGCYPPEVYPDQHKFEYRWPEDFTSDTRDNLGNNHGQFGLTLLVRGLYQVAAALAVELGTEEGCVMC